jgi:hypothetical protein
MRLEIFIGPDDVMKLKSKQLSFSSVGNYLKRNELSILGNSIRLEIFPTFGSFVVCRC